MNMNTILRFLMLFVLVLSIGCSKGNSVTGKVTLSDGTPLTRGEVTFSTPTFVAAGMIQSDGIYSIRANNMKEGIPTGTYSVTVKAYEDIQENPDGAMENLKPAKSLIDTKYTSPATSGLTCEVNGSITFNISVEPFK
ncbi:MAG: carboxypeptidase-like regulatory domain-containing protein [Planctomycetaceae bacterium]|jgi:hypothetical protein|nr:carboxypeptidase-like regulatory domain-containing protein [Planctomycetaceae bacterium]